MRFVKSALMGTGALALAAMLLNLLAPKAAHAIVATAVQVVNTTADPAIAQDTSKQASQLVTLTASVSANSFGTVFQFHQLYPQGGSSISSYIVPATQSLVITSIEFAPTAGSGTLNLQLWEGFSLNIYERWKVAADTITELQYPSGIVLGHGTDPIVLSTSSSTTAAFEVYLHGYLTTN
jgi:hypothetical protein